MNRNEKKFQKIKWLYSLLNKQNERIAIQEAKESKVLSCSTYAEFSFDFDSEYACFKLSVYKTTVRYSEYSGLSYMAATGLDHYTIMDVFFGSEFKNFKNIKPAHLNDYISQLTKFVRCALKVGMASMSYGTQTERVKVSNYLDFELKSIGDA